MNYPIIKKNEAHKIHKYLLLALIIITGCLKIYWSQGSLFLSYEANRSIHSIVISRDLERRNFDIFNTEVYYDGKTVKYVQAFPAYKIIVGGLYKIFGEHEIIGRYVSIVSFSVALYFLFHIILYYLSAWWALLCVYLFNLALPVIYHSYMFQPTSFENMLLILSLYYLHKLVENPEKSRFYNAWFFLTILTILVKITFLVYLLPIIYLFSIKYGAKFLFQKKFLIFSITLLAANGLWYYYGVSKTFPFFREAFLTYFKDTLWAYYNAPELLCSFYKIIFNYILNCLTLPGFVVFIIGFIIVLFNKRYYFILCSFISTSALLILLLHKYKIHRYNYVNLLIWLTVIAVIGIKHIFDSERFSSDFKKYGRSAIIAVFILFYSINGIIQFLPMQSENRAYIESLSRRIKDNTSRDSRIVIYCVEGYVLGEWSQEYFYASERKGWIQKLHAFSSFRKFLLLIKGVTNLAVVKPAHLPDIFMYPREHNRYKRIKWHSVYEQYTLIDSIYDDYLLFDTTVKNKREKESNSGIRASIDFDNDVRLEKIIPKYQGLNLNLKYLWQSLSEKISGNYIFLALNSNHCDIFNHRILNKAFPTTKWRNNYLYAEQIRADEAYFNSISVPEFKCYPVLYDPVRGKTLFPKPNDKGEVPILIILKTGGKTEINIEWQSSRNIENPGFLNNPTELRKLLATTINKFLKKDSAYYRFIRERVHFQ